MIGAQAKVFDVDGWCVVRFIALVAAAVMATVSMVGCGSLQKTTVIAEMSLASATSLCYHTIDGVDQLMTDRIRVEMLNGDHDKALQDYADYKPKIEKARAGCNAAEDTLENADKERIAASKINKWDNFNAWLPALAQAAALVTQVIADIKGMVQP